MLQRDAVLLDRYQVMGNLGNGVYLVEGTQQSGRRFALKEMAIFARDRLSHFDREAAQWMAVRHKNIPVVHDFFQNGAAAYIVMDYIPGQTLWDILTRQAQAPTWDKVMGWATQMMDALQALHDKQLVLRQLEPSNCMILPDGTLKVIGLGLSRTLGQAPQNGFTAPEGRAIGNADPRSDIYSLGATLYCLASRHVPPQASQRSEENSALPMAPGVDAPIHKVLEQMLALDPAKRFQSIGEARQALITVRAVAALKWRPSAARPPSTTTAPPAPEEEDEDEVTSLQKYLGEVVGDYRKYVESIGSNGLAAPMVLYYRDEIQDTLEALEELDVDTQPAWRHIVGLDLQLKGKAPTLVHEIGYENFKQYWIMNDPPLMRWWWYLSKNVSPPLPGPKFWEFWKKR